MKCAVVDDDEKSLAICFKWLNIIRGITKNVHRDWMKWLELLTCKMWVTERVVAYIFTQLNVRRCERCKRYLIASGKSSDELSKKLAWRLRRSELWDTTRQLSHINFSFSLTIFHSFFSFSRILRHHSGSSLSSGRFSIRKKGHQNM